MAIDEVDITPSAKIFSDKSAMQRYSKQDGDNEHNWTYAFAEIVDNSIDSCKGRCAETGGRVKVSALRTPNNPLRVVIKFEADGNSAWVSVHDNGPGLKDLVSMLRLGERDEMKEHTIGGYGVGGKYAVNRLGARTFFASQDGGGTVRQALLDIDMILLDGWKAPVREDPEGEHVPVIESSKRGFERPVPSPWYEKTLNSAGVGETFTTVQISKLRNDVLKGLHFSFELLKARLEEMYVRQTIISRTLCLDFRGPSGPPVFRPIHELLEAQENQPATAPRPLEMKAVLKFGGEHPVSQKMTVVINYVPRRVATQSPGLRALLRPNVSPSHPEGDGEQEEQMEWGGRGRLTSQGVKGRSSLSPPSASSSSSSSGAGGGEGAEDQVVIDADALDDGEEESASSSSSSGQRRGHLIPFHCQTPVFAFYEDRMIPVDFREAPKLVSLALEQLNKRTEKSAIEAWQIVTFLLLEEPQAVSLSSSSSSSSGGKGTEGIRPTENKLGFEKLKKLKDAFNLLFRSQTASASAQEGDESPLKEVSFSLAQMDGQLKPMLEKRCDDLGIPWRASHLPSILACAMQLWWSSFENKYIWQRDSVTWPGSFRSFQITRAVSSAAARGRRTEKGPEVLDDLATSLVSAYDLVLARGSNRGRNGKVWVGASPHIAPVRVRPLSSAAAAAASGHDDCQEGDVEEEAESLWIDLNSLRAYREGGEESVRPRIFSGPVDEWQQRAASQEKTQEGHEEGGGAPEADLKESHITMTGRKGDIVVCALSGKVHAGFVGNVFLSKVLELDAQREGLKVQLQPEWMYAPLRNGALDSDGCLLVHLE
uniref:Histidine kinase/HSP90-like ATPase domain-containing protein n=1 Tax=Chromera velia CCMP2878 TaxID=1169474 RepID=A0A0G4HJX3_9ALVE|eukprot:Cvel_28424.t1-p1 / transcript=Cvel_28424.t1 / gene=Cvel_28424 / organism=Chromera_velia_CCMP2878 / gene_product=hypothetical protein / transcript_product=hypothetical protein / location=Cvel_scaffold3718:10262-13943(+) / protein_length=822 / sequence_SO=supercontig / SO=protein_coding / is_pseudo=false